MDRKGFEVFFSAEKATNLFQSNRVFLPDILGSAANGKALPSKVQRKCEPDLLSEIKVTRRNNSPSVVPLL